MPARPEAHSLSGAASSGRLGSAGEGGAAPEAVALDAILLASLPGRSREERVALAIRIAGSPVPLPETTAALAADEPAVAAPVLARSPALDDQALLAAAAAGGAGHRAAIAVRPRLAAAVTDLLIATGEPGLLRALAAHEGARLSPAGIAVLVERSRRDPRLWHLLARRSDLPAAWRRRIRTVRAEGPGNRRTAALPSGER